MCVECTVGDFITLLICYFYLSESSVCVYRICAHSLKADQQALVVQALSSIIILSIKISDWSLINLHFLWCFWVRYCPRMTFRSVSEWRFVVKSNCQTLVLDIKLKSHKARIRHNRDTPFFRQTPPLLHTCIKLRWRCDYCSTRNAALSQEHWRLNL